MNVTPYAFYPNVSQYQRRKHLLLISYKAKVMIRVSLSSFCLILERTEYERLINGTTFLIKKNHFLINKMKLETTHTLFQWSILKIKKNGENFTSNNDRHQKLDRFNNVCGVFFFSDVPPSYIFHSLIYSFLCSIR